MHLKAYLSEFPFERVQWITFVFLFGTLAISVVGIPLYIWAFGLTWVDIALFVSFFCLTGLSITLGYHRLFAHKTFETRTPIKLICLLFGAAAFENSALDWTSDHRRHHKHVDHDGDPYDISKGLLWAHMGWVLFKLKPLPPMDNVPDLMKDKLVMWQHRHWVSIGVVFGFVLPAVIGGLAGGWVGALGGLLFGGVLRVVCVQHCTFCINSLCHSLGNQPYSAKCSARDSWIMALVTFGEGYHNFHHEFQHDYRNGVKPWQFDPTKWIIWTMSKLGLAWRLRTVPDEKIEAAQLKESARRAGKIVEDEPEEGTFEGIEPPLPADQ